MERNNDVLTIEEIKIPTDKEEIGSAFRLLRYATGMNRKELSDYLNIPYNTMRDWEQGQRAMPPYVFELIFYKLKNENMFKKNHIFNSETEEAVEEAKRIMLGKKKTKTYSSSKELFDELDKE